MIKGKFIDNLPKVYGIYTGGFIGFIILMAIGEQMGMSAKAIGVAFVAFTIFIYALIGYLSRTAQADAYYVAGRQVPTVFNGMATAADWMSGASFVAMAGGIYFKGYGYMALLVGWTGGYILVATLLAPYLRKFGCYTVPDFVGTRYGGNLARLCAVIVLTVASFTYVTAQINATGTIASVALDIDFKYAVYIGLISILLCSMLGGMRAVTWTQVAQYIVLIIAYLLPIFWISNKMGAGFFPHFMLADEVARIGELEKTDAGADGGKEFLTATINQLKSTKALIEAYGQFSEELSIPDDEWTDEMVDEWDMATTPLYEKYDETFEELEAAQMTFSSKQDYKVVD